MSDRLKTVAALIGVGMAALVVAAALPGPIASGVRRVFTDVTPNNFPWLLDLAFGRNVVSDLNASASPTATPGQG